MTGPSSSNQLDKVEKSPNPFDTMVKQMKMTKFIKESEENQKALEMEAQLVEGFDKKN